MARPSMYPIGVKDEHKCLYEIRSKGPNIHLGTVLPGGIRAVDFALYFVCQYHLKRKEKVSKERADKSCLDTASMQPKSVSGP